VGEVYKATIGPNECEEGWIGGRTNRLLVLKEEALRTIEISKESRLGELNFEFYCTVCFWNVSTACDLEYCDVYMNSSCFWKFSEIA